MYISCRVDVEVRNRYGEEIPPKCYDVDYDDDTIFIDLNNIPFEMKDSDVLRKIRDIANEKCPEFLPHLDDLERQMALEYLREC